MSTASERFWSKVDKSSDCWIWKGAQSPNGYGRAFFDGKSLYAHRAALLLTHGEVPPIVDHQCRQKLCVNPSHLKATTKSENARIGIPGAWSFVCKRGHQLTADNAYMYERNGRTLRQCKTCALQRSAMRKAA